MGLGAPIWLRLRPHLGLPLGMAQLLLSPPPLLVERRVGRLLVVVLDLSFLILIMFVSDF